MDLKEARKEINSIDKEIVKLLERRFNVVKQIGLYKIKENLPVYDGKREEQVIDKCTSFLENKKYSSYIASIYFEIMKNSKDIQENLKGGK